MMMIAAMVVMMVLPTSLSAQSLFGRRENGQNRYMLKNDESVYGLMNNTNRAVFTGTNEPGLGNQGFNQDPQPAPLGSGVFMLIAAGAGYAVLKNKKSKN